MQTEERAAQARAMQSAQEQAFTALCQHLEHAPDRQILSDHTAVLVFGTDFDRREEALRLIRGQLYSRNSRTRAAWRAGSRTAAPAFRRTGTALCRPHRTSTSAKGLRRKSGSSTPPKRQRKSGSSASGPPANSRPKQPSIWWSPTCPGAWSPFWAACPARARPALHWTSAPG